MKTKIYKKLNLEISETMHYGKTFAECMKLRPKGWDLLVPSEALAHWQLKPHKHWFFVKQIIKEYKGKYVARFFADSDWACLDCGRYPDDRDSSLGVKWCRKLKEVKNE